MTSASFFPSPIRCCGQTLRTASLCVSRSDLHGNRDKEPLIVSSKFPFAYVHHCPGQRVFELDSLALGSAAADLLLHPALPLSLPVFPPLAARKGHLWRPQWEEVGTVLRWAWNKGLQTSGAALLTSMQRRQKIVFKTKNITIRFNLGLTYLN